MKVNEYYRASSLEDAYQKLQEDPRNAILAGGLWIKKMGQAQNVLVDLSTLGLNKISENEKEVIIGSMVTQRDFENSNWDDILTTIASLTGLPAISIPCGSDDSGMPFGIQIIAPHYKEKILFDFSKEIIKYSNYNIPEKSKIN